MATFSTGPLSFNQSWDNDASGFYCIAKTPNTWRVAADGVRYGLVTHMNPAMAGRGGSTTSAVYVANSSGTGAVTSSSFSVAGGSSAVFQGNKAISKLLKGNTNYRFGFTQPGLLYYGRGGTGRVYRMGTNTETPWATQLAITVTVAEVPGTPTNVTLTPSSGLDVAWEAPTQTGGSAITGYRIEWADNALFTGAEHLDVSGTSGTIDASGSVYVRVGAINAVAAAADTTGPWSEVVSGVAAEVPEGGFTALAFDDAGFLFSAFSTEPYVIKYDLEQGAPVVRWYPVTSTGTDVAVAHQLANFGTVNDIPQMLGAFNATPQLSSGAIQVYPIPNPDLESAIRYYVGLISEDLVIQYDATHNPIVSIPGWSADVWTMLNQLCASHSVELAVVNDTITVRDCAIRSLSVEDKANTNRGVSLQAASRYITAVWTNAVSGSGVVYDASEDNRVFSISSGESMTTVIGTQNSPAYIPPITRTAVIPIGPNSYLLSDSTGVSVPLGLFEDAGGDVRVKVSTDIPGAIELTIVGPINDIPGFPGPYRLAYPTSDGSAGDTPALRVSGSGVFMSPGEERIYTGADPSATTREEGVRVDTPFLETRAHAYDRGVWAAAKVSGSWPTVSFLLSTKDCEGFGLTSGSLFEFQNCIFRVISSTVTRSGLTVSAEFHTTADDWAERWAGSTAQDVADHWAGYVARDIPIRPLR